MAELIDVNELMRKQQTDEIEKGANLIRLARTYLEKMQLEQAWKTCEDAEEVLSQYAGTVEFAELLILQGDILARRGLPDAEDYYRKAKSEIAPPFAREIQKTSYAKASKHLGMWLSGKNRSQEARAELSAAAKTYVELSDRTEASICYKELWELDAQEEGNLPVFESFFDLVMDSEPNLEICLLAWRGHLDITSKHVVARRSDDNRSLGPEYCAERIKEAREKWQKGARPF